MFSARFTEFLLKYVELGEICPWMHCRSDFLKALCFFHLREHFFTTTHCTFLLACGSLSRTPTNKLTRTSCCVRVSIKNFSKPKWFSKQEATKAFENAWVVPSESCKLQLITSPDGDRTLKETHCVKLVKTGWASTWKISDCEWKAEKTFGKSKTRDRLIKEICGWVWRSDSTCGAEHKAERIQATAIIILPRCSLRLSGFSTA